MTVFLHGPARLGRMTEKVGGYMNFRGFSSLRKYGIFSDFNFFDGSVGAHGAQGPGGLGAQGPWGPVITTRALGPRGLGAPLLLPGPRGPQGYAQQAMGAHASGVLIR